ncbi:Bax inhibitor 1 [Cichlidogyrus casuarinus]|uniref:Bax inhibitor 1 n=1 Tax=Cichlidogyrus casuarinus TaxID=1844966 RepID=A0ABD2QHN6_9PLAT
MGPLVLYTSYLNPEIIITALLTTTLIFVSFTLAAFFSNRRSFIYLGGFLLSMTSTLLLMGLFNIFFRFETLFYLQLYSGLFVFSLYVLYDTQLICEKARLGDKDFIWHSFDLFLDFIQIFRHILVILGDKEERRRRN